MRSVHSTVDMDEVSAKLRAHYAACFREHGVTAKGVDWGQDESRLALRYAKMLEVISSEHQSETRTLLDVGSGFGGLLGYAQAHGFRLSYTGVDVCDEMLASARAHYAGASFIVGDVLEMRADQHFDFVVCNGVLTQKLDTPATQMDQFAGRLVRKMFELANIGVAFNVMTTKVNFFSNRLYYRNPAEMLSWCLTELTPKVRIDHSYPLHEYTVYLYR